MSFETERYCHSRKILMKKNVKNYMTYLEIKPGLHCQSSFILPIDVILYRLIDGNIHKIANSFHFSYS